MARVIEGGEMAGINGFMHMIDNVLIYEPDIRAHASMAVVSDHLLLVVILFTYFFGGTRRR